MTADRRLEDIRQPRDEAAWEKAQEQAGRLSVGESLDELGIIVIGVADLSAPLRQKWEDAVRRFTETNQAQTALAEIIYARNAAKTED